MAARIYTDKDVDLHWLRGKTCAVIGFGAQGRAHALNLMDSGISVIVGFIREMTTSRRHYNELMRAAEKHPIEAVGRKVRGLMSWKSKKTNR